MANEKKHGWWRKPWVRRSLVAASVLLLLSLSMAAIMWLPGYFVDKASGISPTPTLTTAERVTATTNARQGVLFIVGGVIAILTLLITLAKHNLDRKGQDIEREKQELDRDANWTNLYTEGLKQLGAESSPSIRLGGIYALERIAQDSTRDQRTILDVLCAFVRERSPLTPPRITDRKLDTDVAAALTVCGRRNFLTHDEVSFDLSNTFLGGAKLSNANLAHTNFEFSDLRGAHLSYANLAQVSLLNANLTNAELFETNLQSANLIRADLTRANLGSADLSEAVLYEATLNIANLSNAKLHKVGLSMAKMHSANMIHADFTGATLCSVDLTNARLNDAILVDADLDGAILNGADLTGARMAGAVVHDAAGKMDLVTYEYLEAAGALGLDSIQGLPARSTNGNAADAH